jgi:hypothetical protein
VPLGPNAVMVWVHFVEKPEAFLWRPTSDLFFVGDALGNSIAWPADKVLIE